MIYTIGTSDRTFEAFSRELLQRGVKLWIDVRSSPASRAPWFNQRALERAVPELDARYLWLGPVFGGRSIIGVEEQAFHAALDRLREMGRSEPVAIFCAEGDPTQCHRTYKIGAALLLRHPDLEAVSILRNGSDEPITQTLGRTRKAHFPEGLWEQLVAGDLIGASRQEKQLGLWG